MGRRAERCRHHRFYEVWIETISYHEFATYLKMRVIIAIYKILWFIFL